MTENKNNQTTQIHTPTNHAPETVPAEWVLASKFEELTLCHETERAWITWQERAHGIT